MGSDELTAADLLPVIEKKSEDDLETLQKQAARLKTYYKYRNDYNRTHYERINVLVPPGTKDRMTHYERINVLVPPGTKDRIRAVTDISLSSFIYKCIEQELLRLEAAQAENEKA